MTQNLYYSVELLCELLNGLKRKISVARNKKPARSIRFGHKILILSSSKSFIRASVEVASRMARIRFLLAA